MPSLCHSKAVEPFRETFNGIHMHFNHFIKLQDWAVITPENLLLYLAHGVVALGTSCQQGLNAVYSFIYGGPYLIYMQVGFIIVQVKNNPKIYWALLNAFLNIDPFMFHLFCQSDLKKMKHSPSLSSASYSCSVRSLKKSNSRHTNCLQMGHQKVMDQKWSSLLHFIWFHNLWNLSQSPPPSGNHPNPGLPS